jgi:hypothetical protein
MFDSVCCLRCGSNLICEAVNNIFQETLISAVCPQCAACFDPSNLQATYTQSRSGQKSALAGGTTYRFALIVDNVPLEERDHFTVDPDFIRSAKRVFCREFREVADTA